jgi:hypothetical protein
MEYTGTLISDLTALTDRMVHQMADARMMAEAIADLDPFGPYSRPCWDMEPMDERERR